MPGCWPPGSRRSWGRVTPERSRGRAAPGGEVLVTSRLRLVPLRTADAAEMVHVLGDPDLYAFTGGGPPSVDDLRDRYRRQAVGWSPDGREAWRNWIVRTHDPDEAVGFVQSTITGGGDDADIAWIIGVPWQGRGFATEAARAMVAWLETHGVTTITAHVHPEHAASARVADRAGLVATDEVEDGELIWRLDPTERRAGEPAGEAGETARGAGEPGS